MVPCPHYAGDYKNANSLHSHVSRVHGSGANSTRPRGLRVVKRPRSTDVPVGPPRATRKEESSRGSRLSASDKMKLDVSLRVQEAYQLGQKAGKLTWREGLTCNNATQAAQEEVASLREEVDTLRSRLASLDESATAQAFVLSGVANERGELREEQRCRVCMDRQRSVAVMPCNHIPLCYECLLDMRGVAGAQRIKCPTCREICSGYLELSPGALPRAA